MPEADAGSPPRSVAQFERLAKVRWEAYSVSIAGKAAGYVSCLPEGLWIAYRDNGTLPGRFETREEAAAALTGDGAVVADRAQAKSTTAGGRSAG